MCDEADGYCQVYSEYTRRARKLHKCDACPDLIRPGDVYHRTDSLYDGSWSHVIHCARCRKVYEAIRDRSDERPLWIDPSLMCGETWESAFGEPPPPEIAALAFALPGEVQIEGLATP